MSTTTTIKVGESAKTITLPEGKALILTGSTGAVGVAYLLDPILGGTNAQKSWQVGTGPLAAIGPYAGHQKVLVACSAGSIDALVQEAVLSVGGTAATITGNFSVGGTVTATLPTGALGTLQFTRTMLAAPFTKSNISGAVANAVNSLSYVVQTADRNCSIDVDVSNVVVASHGGAVPISAPLAPTITNITAGDGSVTVTLTRNSDNGGDTVTGDRIYVWKAADSTFIGYANGTSPITLTGIPNGVPVYATAATVGASKGAGPQSAPSATATPSASTVQPKLAILNWSNPNSADLLGNNTRATAGRQAYTTCSDEGVGAYVIFPSYANGNSGDVLTGGYTGQVAIEYNGQFQLLKRDGNTTITVASGEVDPKSDPIDWTQWGIMDGKTPKDAKVYFRYDVARPDSTTSSPAGQVVAQDAGNSCYIYNPDTVTAKSAVAGTGQFTVTATANSYTRTGGMPFMLVHRPVNPATYVAFLAYGASQADGGTDVGWTAPFVSGRGFLRACVGASRNVAGGKCATSGNATASMTGANTLTYSTFKYFTHVLVDLGGNDIGALNGTTDRTKYFTVEAILRTLWSTIRTQSPGVKLIHLIKPPCVTDSTDGFATIENQTIGTEWGMSNGTSGTTSGRGDLFRQWGIEQVNTSAAGEFTGVITNSLMTVSGVNSAKRRPAIGDVITATGYTGTIISISSNADNDGNGTYGISPSVPAGLSSRAFTCAVPPGGGVDFALQVTTAPGRRDLWPIATSTGWGLPGDAAIGVPAGSSGSYNHMLANQYIATSKLYLRGPILGIND